MKTIWDSSCRQEILARLEKLTPETRARWGGMNAGQVIAHLTDPMRAAMGEMEVRSKPGVFRNPLVRYLIIYWLPWPKGAPTAPEFIHTEACDFQRNLADFRVVLKKFVSRVPDSVCQPHAAFGSLSHKDWGRLTYRHLYHHLRQFGV